MVPLDISQIVVKAIGPSVDTEPACDWMPHAEDPVPTLQKGNKAEGAHNIAGKRGRLPEAELPLHMAVLGMKMKLHPLRRKIVLSQFGLGTIPTDKASLSGEGDVPVFVFRDDLDGTGPPAPTGMNGWNQGQGLGGRLALEVLAAKAVPHRLTSQVK